MKTVIGIDIGGTNFRMAEVDCNGKVYNFIKKSSCDLFKNSVVDSLHSEINDYINSSAVGDVMAITIGIPSIVSKDKKTVLSTPNLKGFDNVNITDELSDRLLIPVLIDKDVNFLLLNDIYTLNLDKEKIIAGFYIGTGFGNAMYINKNFLQGKNGAAGELGHIPLYGIEDKCTCGNVSCAETRCSGKYLEILAKEHFPDTAIYEVFKYHADDPIIIKFVRDLAIPIATEINILDPDYVVIAGGVIMMEGFPKQLLTEAIHYYSRKPLPNENLDIRFTAHTQQSGVLGGAKFAFETINYADIR